MSMMLFSLLISLLIYEISLEHTKNNLLRQQTSSDGRHVLTILQSRVNLMGSAASILSRNVDVITALKEENDDSLSIINSRSVIMRDRFELDLIQVYNQEGFARANLVIGDLYQVSSLQDLIEINTTEVFEVGESLLALTHIPMQTDAGSVIVGIDLERELSRISINGNLDSHICIRGLEENDEILACSKPVGEEHEHAYIQEYPIQIGSSEMIIQAGGDLVEMTHVINTGRNVVIGSILMAMVLMILLSERVIKAVSNPITSLVEATKALSKGAFDDIKPNCIFIQNHENPLGIGVNDEIGQLASSFTSMEVELRRLYMGLIKDLEESHCELVKAYDMTLKGWSSALELRDHDTEQHTQRVTQMTIALARKIGVPEEEIIDIRRGALLHDVGKLAIPDRLLHKPAPLTDEEWEIMKQHPLYAYVMIREIPYLKNALDIPYCHHESWDGSGYPLGIRGEAIPLSARIFAVIDTWDALISHRPYREAWPKLKALHYIESQAGKKFDPEVVKAFIDWMRERGFIC